MHSDLLQPELWTNGAFRALTRARNVAGWLRESEVTSTHLFWALLMDEGRAGVALENAGLTTGVLRTLHPRLANVELEAIVETTIEANWSAEAVEIVREARHAAYQEEGTSEVGTDHILSALSSSGTPVAHAIAACMAQRPAAEQTSTLPEEARTVVPELSIPAVDLVLRERGEPNLAEVYRILDAAANRGREGLRVVEDHARFGINDRYLSGQLKALRHDFTNLLSELPQAHLLACRDTTGDVGTSIEGYGEYRRTDVADVLTAAFKRAQEATRTVEEYSKIVSGDLSRGIEQLRYRLYQLEKAVLQSFTNRVRLANRNLYLLLTNSACAGGFLVVLKAALEAGVRLIQVREKTMSDRELLQHCRELRQWTRQSGALLIINDRPDIAALADADGVHVGQEELSVADARRIVGPERLVGVSTHSLEQAHRAVMDGADYLGVGPTFPSTTKSFQDFPGLSLIREVSAEISLPWFAIGGITEENIEQVLAAGARRIAVTGAISGSSSPLEATSTLMRALKVAPAG